MIKAEKTPKFPQNPKNFPPSLARGMGVSHFAGQGGFSNFFDNREFG